MQFARGRAVGGRERGRRYQIWIYHLPELRALAEIIEALDILGGTKTRNSARLTECVSAALNLGLQ
ncbi:hypothetical protein OHR68_06360 [Spirillospora sp. NBC_00431]